jgi:hypothetical protein
LFGSEKFLSVIDFCLWGFWQVFAGVFGEPIRKWRLAQFTAFTEVFGTYPKMAVYT